MAGHEFRRIFTAFDTASKGFFPNIEEHCGQKLLELVHSMMQDVVPVGSVASGCYYGLISAVVKYIQLGSSSLGFLLLKCPDQRN